VDNLTTLQQKLRKISMSIRSINSLVHRTQAAFAKDEYKEALLHALSYENPRSHVLCFKDEDINNFANGNLISKLFILDKSGYIVMKYTERQKGEYLVDNMAITPTGIELLESYSFNILPKKTIKQLSLATLVAIVVYIVMGYFGFR
jgi:hypothetical protein